MRIRNKNYFRQLLNHHTHYLMRDVIFFHQRMAAKQHLNNHESKTNLLTYFRMCFQVLIKVAAAQTVTSKQ